MFLSWKNLKRPATVYFYKHFRITSISLTRHRCVTWVKKKKIIQNWKNIRHCMRKISKVFFYEYIFHIVQFHLHHDMYRKKKCIKLQWRNEWAVFHEIMRSKIIFLWATHAKSIKYYFFCTFSCHSNALSIFLSISRIYHQVNRQLLANINELFWISWENAVN